MHWTKCLFGLLICVSWLACSSVKAEDWPMWRYGPERGAASTEKLPTQLGVEWELRFPARKQTWDDPLNADLMTYDRLLEPILVGNRLFIGFNDSDKVSAFDLKTGDRLWDFYTEGPVRLPLASFEGNIYFTSDDGYLYCVACADGKELWRFRGGPSARHAIGNQRLVSAWPARGGPVIRDGKVYFAASIWPFMGVFLYSLDAKTGEVLWINDESGSQYIKQPHSAPSFAGVGPQGALVATKEALIVPGGRSVPAVFDRKTGKQRYYELNAGGKGTGGTFVAASENSWFVHTRFKGTRQFSLESGLKTAFLPNEPVLKDGQVYSAELVGGKPMVCMWNEEGKKLWEIEADGRGDLILAGNTLYAASIAAEPSTAGEPSIKKSLITAIQLPDQSNSTSTPQAKVLWTLPLEGQVERLIAGNGKLVALTLEGTVRVLGGDSSKSSVQNQKSLAKSAETFQSNRETRRRAESLLANGNAEGYALWFGAQESSLLNEVAFDSSFQQIVVIDEDSQTVDRLRRDWDRFGWLGNRGSIHLSKPNAFQAPPYIANMVFVGEELTERVVQDRALLEEIFNSVRPFGGVLQLLAPPEKIAALSTKVKGMELVQAEVESTSMGLVIRRKGPLPGSSDWTHQHGNIANTIKSDDQLVKLPLGVLWFGGNSNVDVLPRHGHGPPEQVVGGYLIIQGMNSLTARDVYTGRVLWTRSFQDLGTFDVFYDSTYAETPLDPAYNQVHIPGANGRGTNYVVTEDLIYLVEGPLCHVLKTATGETVREIALPQTDPNHKQEWGYIGVYEDVLIGGVGFAKYRTRLDLQTDAKDAELAKAKAGFGTKSLDRAASMAIVGFDRHTGQELWKVDALHSFWHNGIVAGEGTLFALDRNPKGVEDALKRRGRELPQTYRIVAFDIKTGQSKWELNKGIFGTWLGYSQKHNMLLQAGAAASDRLTSEVGQGMAVYNAKDGSVVWSKDSLVYSGPCILHNDLIITNANAYTQSSGAYYLRDGSQKMVKNPLTGEIQPWKITRAYGCNTISASENLLTFRSGAAGYYDLLSEGGTGNLGGFRSGCTSNLVAANGVLNAPDYTRTCSCSYQNQSSLALVHMPELEMWSIDNTALGLKENERIQRLGINLGAPGDRRSSEGVPWLEYPAVGGDSPNLGIALEGNVRTFQDHPMTMQESKMPWVNASGVEGLTKLRVSLRALSPHLLVKGLPILAVADDAEEDAKGAVDVGSSDLELVTDKTDQLIGLRFDKIYVASKSQVRSAAIQFTAHAENSEETSLSIHAEVSGNPLPFEGTSKNLSSRAITSQSIEWKPEPWKKIGESEALQKTPDLTPLIKEVLSHPDWKPGNAIVFIIKGKGKRVATAYAGGKEGAPKLMMDADEVPAPSMNPDQRFAYRVKLYFGLPKSIDSGPRKFEVALQGTNERKWIELDSSKGKEVTYVIDRVPLTDWLEIDFKPAVGSTLLSGVEVQQLTE